jgi:hypothetical protein
MATVLCHRESRAVKFSLSFNTHQITHISLSLFSLSLSLSLSLLPRPRICFPFSSLFSPLFPGRQTRFPNPFLPFIFINHSNLPPISAWLVMTEMKSRPCALARRRNTLGRQWPLSLAKTPYGRTTPPPLVLPHLRPPNRARP